MGACNGKSVEGGSAEEKPMEENKESGETKVEEPETEAAKDPETAPGPDDDEIQKANGTEVVSEEGHTPSPADNRKLAKSKSRSRRRGSVSAESGAYVKDQDEPTRVVPKSDEAKARILVAIEACVLFSETDPEDIKKIVDAMEEKKVQTSDKIITEGQEGDFFYVIESGEYTASKEGQTVFKYDGKGSFGELALMYNCPRAATITADTEGVIWALDRMTFRKIIMTSNIKKRERFETALNQVQCLKTMTEAEKSLIADVVICKTFSVEESVYKIDDPLGDEGKFYIVEQGAIKITDSSGSDEVATNLSGGDVFGHIELLDESLEKRVTTATVMEDNTKVLVMQGDSFRRIIAEDNSHIFTPEAPISI